MDDREIAELLIRIGVGGVMILFGIWQVTKPVDWLKYIPPIIRFLMPFAPTSFMRLHGTGNILLGLLLAAGLLQPVSIWLALAWWAFVTPFAFFAEASMGLRDIAIILSLVALLIIN